MQGGNIMRSRLLAHVRYMITFVIILALACSTQSIGQTNKRDSLQALMDEAKGAEKIPFINALFDQVFPQDLDKATSLCVLMADILRTQPSDKNLFKLYRLYGDLYQHQGKYDSLLIINKKGLELAKRLGDTKRQSDFLSLLGNYQETVGTLDSAIIFYEGALALAAEDSLSLYNTIGQAYSRKGDYTKGMWYLKRAMLHARANNLEEMEISIMLNIGSDYYDTGNKPKAIEYFDQSLALAEKLGRKQAMLPALINLSYSFDSSEKSRVYAIRGRKIAEEIGDKRFALFFVSKIANTYIDEERYQEGLDFLLPAYDSFTLALGRDRQALLGDLSLLYLNLDQYDKAASYGRAAYEVAEIHSGATDLQFARLQLLDIYAEQKNYKKYFEIAQEYYPERDSSDELERIERFSELESLLDEEQKEKVDLLNSTIKEKEKSQWRLAIIGLLVALLLLSILYFRNKRIALQKEVIKREHEAAEELQHLNSKLKELDKFKSRLYTNISHEFRTPLTVILGMTGQLEEHPAITSAAMTDETINRKLKLIQRNGVSLLDLVNKMLDLSKLENNSLTVDYAKGDMVKYLRYLGESFHSLMETKKINFTIETTQEKIIMDYDAEKMRQIIGNLISNAIKYTPPNGAIQLNVDAENAILEIVVSDTGDGISATSLPHVFERFYQADDAASKAGGTGIGLALTKELVELMDGRIVAESKLGKGSTFRINMPIKQESKILAEEPSFTVVQKANKEIIDQRDADDKPTVLIIEDNADVAEYISSCLHNEYSVDIRYDGTSGANHALDTIPDLIISDVMMPGKDGYEVCELLKLDPRTSHVPIILLTAKSAHEERLQGLETGADEYLIKPFDTKELEIRVRKLIELRRTLREQYAQSDLLLPPAASMSAVDKEFIENVAKSVEAHLDDGSYGVDALAQEVNMSKVHLNRKLNTLMDLSANKYIQAFRLQCAYNMLMQKTGNVSEVAMDTGFNSTSYFSKCFREKFDLTPKEVLEKN